MQGISYYKTLLDNLSDGVYFVDRERRITYWNKAAEQLTGYQGTEVLGSKCSDNILVHTDDKGTQLCIDGCPLHKTLNDGLPRQASIYLLHKAGHRVPVNIKVMPILGKRGAIIGAIETFNDDSQTRLLNARIQELRQLAMIDELTNAGNRRYANITLRTRLAELKRYGWSFGVIFCDVDNFKSINDTYGHEVGDEVLKMVARTIAGNIRSQESNFFRWGGDEFLIIVSGVSGKQSCDVAERCRILVSNSALPLDNKALRVTISSGVIMALVEDSTEGIMRRVDSLLRQSKKAGKNCCKTDFS